MKAIDTEQANRLLKLLADGVEQGKDFVLTQAPEVVQQLILWKRAEHTAWVCMGLVGMVVVYFVGRRCYAWIVKDNRHGELEELLCLLGIPSAALLFLLMLLFNIAPCLQVWLAPKVYLLEYLTKLVI